MVAFTTQPAAHAAAGSGVRVVSLHQAVFCETNAPFDDAGCRWQPVTLPHLWEVPSQGPAWGLYRFTLAEQPQEAFGVLTENLSVYGQVRYGTQVVTPAQAPDSDRTYLRYWPQLYAFVLEPTPPGERLHLEVAVRGQAFVKSGLGAIRLAPLHEAHALQMQEWGLQVMLLLALSAASVVAGAVGLFAGQRETLADRLLRIVSVLAVLAGLRTAMNFIVEPWLPWVAWQALSLWLLAAIGVLACLAPAVYLRPDHNRLGVVAAAALLGLAGAYALAPPAWHFPLSEGVFAALSLLAAGLVIRVGWRVARRPDPLGLTLLVPVLLILLTGSHDLALHLGSASLSGRYIQKWSTPALVVMMVVLLARRASAQRAVELELQRETTRRHDLLRDLHDGIGSRLVALSYHARHRPGQTDLVDEIEGLSRELQLIQGAVRAQPTTLEMLLADLRHVYARVGGGNLPLVWNVGDLPAPHPLSAEQAVATARILEEAVANAMKHAPGSAITLTLGPGAEAGSAALEVRDDGPGRFQEGAGAGLLHMRQRAQRAGITLELLQPDSGAAGKAVRLTFPAVTAPGGWWRRLQVWRR